MESRQQHLVRKQKRVSKKLIAQSPTATPLFLPNVEDLIAYGDITSVCFILSAVSPPLPMRIAALQCWFGVMAKRSGSF